MARDRDPYIDAVEITGFTFSAHYIGFARPAGKGWIVYRNGCREVKAVTSMGEAKALLRAWGATRLEDSRNEVADDGAILKLAESA
jgi:hypothetical protein